MKNRIVRILQRLEDYGHKDNEMLDISIRCSTPRVNMVYLTTIWGDVIYNVDDSNPTSLIFTTVYSDETKI